MSKNNFMCFHFVFCLGDLLTRVRDQEINWFVSDLEALH